MKFLFAFLILTAPAAFAAEKQMPQGKFTEEIQKSLPKLFCGEKAYFLQCFSLPEAECATAAKAAVEECVKSAKDKMPATFKSRADGQKWGQEIGNCAGAKFEKTHLAKKVDSADCKNPEKWK